MTYRELEHELEENLDKLMRMYDRGEVSEKEVDKYKQYIKKTLYCYRVIEGKTEGKREGKQKKESDLEVVGVEKK